MKSFVVIGLLLACLFAIVYCQTPQKPHFVNGQHNPEAEVHEKTEAYQQSLREFIKSETTENKVMVFSKSYCPYVLQTNWVFYIR